MKKVLIGVALLMSVRLWAHTITVDGDPSDWVGSLPQVVDTYVTSAGEIIWRDAVNDDNGDGGDAPSAPDNPTGYTYPTDSTYTDGEADITEWRATSDGQNLYFLVKVDSFTSVYYPLITIMMDIDHVAGSGQVYVPQNADLMVSPAIQWEYAVVIADDNVKVFDQNWTDITDSVNASAYLNPDNGVIEVGLNALKLLPSGNVLDSTVNFVVTAGLGEFGNYKEVDSVATQWHGGGGMGANGSEADPDWLEPDIYDLCFVKSTDQANDLNTYKYPGDTMAVIRATSSLQVDMPSISGIKEQSNQLQNKTGNIFVLSHRDLTLGNNITGILVYRSDGTLVKHISGKTIKSGSLTKGVYILKIHENSGSFKTGKLIVTD